MDWLDAVKGVAIFLIVMDHCNVQLSIPGIQIYALPLFFIIGGLFCRTNVSIKEFLIAKVNRLILPFSFFYLTAYCAFYLLKWFAPSLLITSAEGIGDIFFNRQFFNGPIWFIICLFWCHLYMYAISKVTMPQTLKFIGCLVLGCIGYTLGYYEVFVPAFLDVACSSMPYFAIGYFYKDIWLHKGNSSKWWLFFYACLAMLVANLVYYLVPFRLSFHYNAFEGGVWGYVAALASSLGIVYLFRLAGKVQPLVWIGKYSLIILCLHHLIYRPVAYLLDMQFNSLEYKAWLVLIITMLLNVLLVPLCVKLIPWFVGQKDLISRK